MKLVCRPCGGRGWFVGVMLESNKAKSHEVLGQSKPARLGTSLCACVCVQTAWGWICVLRGWVSQSGETVGYWFQRARRKESMHHQWTCVGMQWWEWGVQDYITTCSAPVDTHACLYEVLPNWRLLQDCSLCAVWLFAASFHSEILKPGKQCTHHTSSHSYV